MEPCLRDLRLRLEMGCTPNFSAAKTLVSIERSKVLRIDGRVAARRSDVPVDNKSDVRYRPPTRGFSCKRRNLLPLDPDSAPVR